MTSCLYRSCEPSSPPRSGSRCSCGRRTCTPRPGRAKPVSRFPHPLAPARPGPGRRGYHGDLEWGGGCIATALARSVPWRPWRYTAGEYRAAVTTLAEATLRGPPAATPWDPAPAVALPECGVWAEEETVLNDLLTDLGTRSR
ncbi:DUF2399 domain-containing protein [Streptomyces flaveolus]|uniref:DUF2399 domain-containing protein n=1 Tax=Streptomyces flaveolus TaxID=67297 RepID=UPI0033BE22EA